LKKTRYGNNGKDLKAICAIFNLKDVYTLFYIRYKHIQRMYYKLANDINLFQDATKVTESVLRNLFFASSSQVDLFKLVVKYLYSIQDEIFKIFDNLEKDLMFASYMKPDNLRTARIILRQKQTTVANNLGASVSTIAACENDKYIDGIYGCEAHQEYDRYIRGFDAEIHKEVARLKDCIINQTPLVLTFKKTDTSEDSKVYEEVSKDVNTETCEEIYICNENTADVNFEESVEEDSPETKPNDELLFRLVASPRAYALMRNILGLTISEVAQMFNVSENAVGSFERSVTNSQKIRDMYDRYISANKEKLLKNLTMLVKIVENMP